MKITPLLHGPCGTMDCIPRSDPPFDAPFAGTALSLDLFLGGALRLRQPRQGYRAGVDPVLLGASVPGEAGQSLLDLGCGVGTAALCAGRRVPGLRLTGLERHPGYADLARRNARENGLEMEVFEGDLGAMPAELRARRFDHVIANPPYFRRDASSPSALAHREVAMGEETPLADWVRAAAKRCAPKGHVTFIHRTERLPELLSAFAEVLGSIELKPLVPRAGRESQLVLLRGRKGGRAAFRLHPGLVMHGSDHHPGDREDYTEAANRILRQGGALSFGG